MTTQDSADKHARLFITVNHFEFRLWWVFFMLFHAVCIAYHGIVSYLYYKLPTTNLSSSLKSNAVGLNDKYHPSLVITLAVLAGIHGIILVATVIFSIHARQLTYFYVDCKKKSSFIPRGPNVAKTLVASNPLPPRRCACSVIMQLLLASWKALCGLYRFFSIESKHFDAIFVMREIFETVLQMIQAYRLALYVPRPWLVRGLVVLLVLNCWSTPVMRRIFRNSPARERMTCLLFDVSLDFISTIAIPVVLAVPYISQYDPIMTNFPIPNYQDTAWRALAMSEFRLILVSSWLDLFTRVTLGVSSVAVLFDVKSLFRIKHSTVGVAVNVGPVNKNETAAANKLSPVVSTCPAPLLAVTTHLEKRVVAFLHFLLTMIGLAVLVLHVAAGIQTPDARCALPVVVWGRLTPGCAYVQLNCSFMGMNGSRTEMEHYLSKFDPVSLQALDIAACPQLSLPPALQSFHELSILNVMHSIIEEWGGDAALTTTNHPHISFLLIKSVQMPNRAIPRGLTDPDFPLTLATIALNDTRLNSLPISLATLPPRNSIFLLEFCDLSSIPDAIYGALFSFFSIAGNRISVVPVSLFYAPMIRLLDLSGNPIKELPEISQELQQELGGLPAPMLDYVDMSATQLRAFPSWLQGRQQLHFIATRTPLCDRILANELILPDEQYLLTAVDCTTWTEVGFGF